MQFKLAHDDRWKSDDEFDFTDERTDHDHFVFTDNSAIGLNIMREDSDLASELSKKSKDQLVGEILEGTNAINDLFGAKLTTLIDSRVELDPAVSKLSIHSKQDLPDGAYETLETYYMASGQTLHTSFRWKLGTDEKHLRQARADYEDGKFSLAGLEAAR